VAEEKKTRIVILGGGFAGLHAAVHLDDTLARDPGVEITLVNRDNFFLFSHVARGCGERPRPHQHRKSRAKASEADQLLCRGS
jgi:glycine/D-amino acid oxidase-like deaminating enzyme